MLHHCWPPPDSPTPSIERSPHPSQPPLDLLAAWDVLPAPLLVVLVDVVDVLVEVGIVVLGRCLRPVSDPLVAVAESGSLLAAALMRSAAARSIGVRDMTVLRQIRPRLSPWGQRAQPPSRLARSPGYTSGPARLIASPPDSRRVRSAGGDAPGLLRSHGEAHHTGALSQVSHLCRNAQHDQVLAARNIGNGSPLSPREYAGRPMGNSRT